jgi:choline dehydrogenase-like flavoprotein
VSHDVIIVGSGAAGSVIARRLIDETDARVLLLEAGGEAENPAVHDPARSHELWHAKEDWDYFTVPPAQRRWAALASAAREGDRRLDLHQRDDLHPRLAGRLRLLGLPGERRLDL